MNPAPANFHELARRILERATADCESPAQVAQTIEATFTRLTELVSGMVGEAGFSALVARALHLSRLRLPKDNPLPSQLDPSLLCSCWGAIVDHVGALASVRCATLLFGHVLGLLGSFIGEDLTLRLVRRAWTDADDSGPSSGPGEDAGS